MMLPPLGQSGCESSHLPGDSSLAIKYFDLLQANTVHKMKDRSLEGLIVASASFVREAVLRREEICG
jgi:hypothetical protein